MPLDLTRPSAELAPTTPDPDACLARHFGLGAFREGQREVIDSLLAGRHTLAVMPTGRGKSLCYQLPAMLLPGLTLVVSPLIALMKDQVDALTAKGIPATFINSSLDAEEQRDRIAGMAEGRYRLVYVAPERFRHRGFLEGLRLTPVSLLAVDEAHCLSQWGHDFRPDYLKLPAAIAACGHPTVLAATATATPEVRDDIIQQLRLADPKVVVSGFDRPNLRYVVRSASGEDAKIAKLREVLEKIPGSAIVYAATRRNVESVAERLVEGGIDAVAYHAGLQEDGRAWAQDRFMSDQARVVVATNAFGMGIDKPDVRTVIHYDLPGTIEAYYQEAGRAGRDGHTAFCVLLFSPADRYLQEFFIEGGCPRPETIRGVYRLLVDQTQDPIYLSQEAINRQLPHKAHDMAVATSLNLLERGGLLERLAKGAAVAHIRLLAPDAQAPRSAQQQRLLDHLRATTGATAGLGLELGALGAVVGESREAVHHALLALRQKGVVEYAPPARTRGLRVLKRVGDPLAELDEAYLAAKQERELAKLEAMIGFAYAQRCRRNVVLDYFGEKTEGGCGRCDVCNGQLDPAMAAMGAERPGARVGKGAKGASDATADEPRFPLLYDTLRGLRARLARSLDVPAYMIFADSALRQMATTLPASYDEFLGIKGVGPEKLAKHGDEFLGAIIAFRELNPHVVPLGVPKPGGRGTRGGGRRVAPEGDARDHTVRNQVREQVAGLYREGLSPEEIAARCMRSVSTVEGHLLALGDEGALDLGGAITSEVRQAVLDAADRVGGDRLRALKDALPETISYFEIRVVLHQAR